MDKRDHSVVISNKPACTSTVTLFSPALWLLPCSMLHTIEVRGKEASRLAGHKYKYQYQYLSALAFCDS